MTKTQGGFRLAVKDGEFTDSQIIVMLGENGTGKTTFIRMLVGICFCYIYDAELQFYSDFPELMLCSFRYLFEVQVCMTTRHVFEPIDAAE